MRQVWITRAGGPEVLQVKEAPDPHPRQGELRIKVEAAGINFADILGRMGAYPDLPGIPIVVGYEVGGRVDEVGPGVDPAWVGRDVAALTRFGGYSDLVCVTEPQLFPRPAGMSAFEGAALPVNYVTAYQLVEVMGGLHAGETVLVHSAAGGVGIAAVQLARRIGASVIGTASPSKHAFLQSLGVKPIGHAEDWPARVLELTGGAGVELVLDAVGGSSFKKSYRVLSPTGRLGLYGISTVATGPRRSLLSLLRLGLTMPWFLFNPARLMNENKGVFGVNLGRMWSQAARVRGWTERLLAYYAEGAIKPHVDRTFPFAEAGAAHQYIQDRKNLGKVLLVP